MVRHEGHSRPHKGLLIRSARVVGVLALLSADPMSPRLRGNEQSADHGGHTPRRPVPLAPQHRGQIALAALRQTDMPDQAAFEFGNPGAQQGTA